MYSSWILSVVSQKCNFRKIGFKNSLSLRYLIFLACVRTTVHSKSLSKILQYKLLIVHDFSPVIAELYPAQVRDCKSVLFDTLTVRLKL